jgi:RimJ/RimL family protein N-acetyltransferase
VSEVRILPGPPASLDPVTIHTPRLDLIPLDDDTRGAIREGRAEGRAWAEGYPTPGDLDVAGLPSAPEPWTQYAIVERASGLSVGGVGFHREPIDGAVEVGYGIAPVARGRGLVTEALRALLEVADAHGVAVVAETDDGNVASERVLERCGFARVRHERDCTVWRWSGAADHR